MNNKSKLLIGNYGADNFGDELILRQFIEVNGKQRFIILSYGINYTNANVVNTYFWKKSNKLHNLKMFISSLFKVDEVIWVGGTCFTDQDGDGAFIYMCIAKLFFKKISYINIGINELLKKERILKLSFLLLFSDIFTFRDKFSYNLSQKYKLPLFRHGKYCIEPDLGEQYLKKNIELIDHQNNILLISWRTLSRYIKDESIIINDLCQFILKIHNQFDQT